MATVAELEREYHSLVGPAPPRPVRTGDVALPPAEEAAFQERSVAGLEREYYDLFAPPKAAAGPSLPTLTPQEAEPATPETAQQAGKQPTETWPEYRERRGLPQEEYMDVAPGITAPALAPFKDEPSEEFTERVRTKAARDEADAALLERRRQEAVRDEDPRVRIIREYAQIEVLTGRPRAEGAKTTYEASLPGEKWTPEHTLAYQTQREVWRYAQNYISQNEAIPDDLLTAAREVPERLRLSVLFAVQELAKGEERARAGLLGEVIVGLDRGIYRNIYMPLKEFVHLGGTEDEWDFYKRLIQIREGASPIIAKGAGWLRRSAAQAAEMFPAMYLMHKLGQAGGKYAKGKGWGKFGTWAAQAGGVTAGMLPLSYSHNIQAMREAGISMSLARPLAMMSGIFEGAIETITMAPFRLKNKAAVVGAKNAMRKFLIQKAKDFAGEVTEEVLQGWVSGAARVGGTWLDKNAPKQNIGKVFMEGVNQGLESIGPLMFLMGPSAIAGGFAARAEIKKSEATEKLEAEIRRYDITAKGWVTMEEGEALGLTEAELTNRESRMAAVVKRIKAATDQLEKEKEDAVPREEAEVQPAEEVRPEEKAAPEGEVPVEEPAVEPEEAAPEAPVRPVEPTEAPPPSEPTLPAKAAPEAAQEPEPAPEAPPEEPRVEKPQPEPPPQAKLEPEPENVWRGKHVDEWPKAELAYVAKKFGLKPGGLNKAAIIGQIKQTEQNILDYAEEQGIKPPMLLQAVELALAAEREQVTEQREGLKAVRDITHLTPSEISDIENAGRDYDSVPRYDEAVQEINSAHPGMLVDPLNPEADPADVLWNLLKKSQKDLVLPRADARSVLEAAEALLQGSDFRVPEKVISATPEEIEAANLLAQQVQDISTMDEAAALEMIRRPEPAVPVAPAVAPAQQPPLQPTTAGAEARREAVRSLKEDLGSALADLTKALGDTTAKAGGLDPKILEALGKLVYQAGVSSAKLGKAGLLTFVEFMAQLPAEFQKFKPQLRTQWERLRLATKGHRMAPAGEELPLFAQKPPEKPPEPEGDLVGISNQLVEEFREKHGLPGFEGVTPQTFEETMNDARALLAKDHTLPTTILTDLATAEPRPLTPMEIAVLTLHKRQLVSKLDDALATMVSAKDPAEKVEAENTAAGLLQAIDSMDQLTTAPEAAGTAAGRALVFRKMALAEDFSLEGLIRRRTKAKGERPNTQEVADLKAMADRFAKLEARLEEMEAQAAMDAEIGKSQPRKRLSPAERKAAAGDRARTAAAMFVEKWGALGAVGRFQDPKKDAQKKRELLDAGIELVRAYVELGARTFTDFIARAKATIGADIGDMRTTLKEAWNKVRATGEVPQVKVDRESPDSIGRLARKLTNFVVESGITDREEVIDAVHEELAEILKDPNWTRRQTRDAISGYGRYRLLSKDEISKEVRRIVGESQQLSKLEDMAARKAPKLTGVERREAEDEERRLIAKVNEAKKRGGYEITDPARQLKTALGSAKTAVRNRITDLDQEIRTRERNIKERKLLKVDPELEALRKQRDELKAEWDKVFPKEPLTDEQKAKQAAKALNRTINQMEADLKVGKIWPKPKGKPISTPELEAERAEIAALRAQRDELRNQQDPNRAYRTGLAKRLTDLQQRLADKDFARKPLRERKLNKEELDLLYEYDQLKLEFRDQQEAYERARRSVPAKMLGAVGDVFNASRSLIVSFDLSAVLRQAKFVVWGHPLMSAKALPTLFKALVSPKAQFAAAEKLRRRPTMDLAMRAGLSITTTEGRLSKQEEVYLGRWMRHVPKWMLKKEVRPFTFPVELTIRGVAASERAYVTFLNQLRMDVFDSLTAIVGGERGVTLDEAKVIANGINVMTGRGPLGKAEPAASLMATILFAPRYVASRFLYNIGQPIWTTKGGYKGTFRARKQMAKEYARTLVGAAVYYGLVELWSAMYDDDDPDKPTVSWDWRSADFGKVRIRETRRDPLAGIAQFTVLFGRIRTGERVTSKGKVVPIRGEKIPYGGMTVRSAIQDFMARKLAPAPQTMLNIVSGETVMHQPVTVMGEVGRLTVPLVVRDIYEAMRDLGVSAGIREGILAIFGEGLNTYGPKTEYMTGTAEERKKQFENDLEQMQWNSEPPAYREYLTDEQMTQVDERREEKKRGVIAATTRKKPDRENYRSDKTYATGLKKREKAMERFREMAKELDHAEAQQLLVEYYRRPGKKGKAGTEFREGTTHTKDSYRKQGYALAKLYGATTEKEAKKAFWAWRK